MSQKPKVSERDSAARAAVGGTIRRIRKQIEPSQERFAIRAGFDRSFYGRVERGAQNIALSTLCTVAEALGVHPSELLRDIDAKGRDAPDAERD